MFPRILVAVDGSPASDFALREATALAKVGSSRLRIVHAVDLAVLEVDGLSQLAAFEASVRAAGQAVLARAVARARRAGVDAESKLLEIARYDDHVAGAIVEEAQRWRASLIVVGTHGRRGFKRALMGSVAESVARSAHTRVLLIRSKSTSTA